MAKNDIEKDVNEHGIFLENNIPKDFEDLDQTFRCQICASLFDKAVTIKECGHTFCSVCIRNYWVTVRSGIHRQKKSCPICRTAVNVMDIEKALVMNRSIQEGVKAFKLMLLKHYESSNGKNHCSPSNRVQRRCRSRKRKSPSTKDDGHFAQGDDNHESSNEKTSGGEESPIHKKMESRNYSRMKKRDLQKLCKELMISTSGSEQELIDRLRNYQNMWNAEVLHSIDPKEPSDIAAQLKKEEDAQLNEKKRARTTGASNSQEYMKKLNASIKSGKHNFTSGNATFDRNFKANFEAMKAQLQARMKRRTESCTKITLKTDGSLDIANHSTEKHSPCEIKERTQPTSSSMEMIDVESCSDVHDKRVAHSRADARQKTTSSLPSSNCNTSPEMQFSSVTCDRSSTCRTKENTITRMDQRSFANKYPGLRNRRQSTSSLLGTSRVTWACRRCTFENKGIDYVCQICGYRKTEFSSVHPL
mmetsp:Transcript_11343/g.28669  ORF Transcript_11343/g.28669 Transcript_11343/m.28669 type:complete len:475 (+) Transcript_11343:149-1573(+)|eukprot:CAMPEP_0116077520 /NCGR_PEP_ID=MMETSP0327-20121206/110_1 /TAXON_ID=44447 /ORGANISM="Pseudo-nitzschia delicatissima, Strain B596" /LENGTH=474 /DNA_ID=CAMNT_0003567999 /DNA_START=119 /DNA_END=1543 /DNA_ORIENTATION=+